MPVTTRTAVPAAPPTEAKGCHGCAFAKGTACTKYGADPAPRAISAWLTKHTVGDYMTPKPGAPECPGRAQSDGWESPEAFKAWADNVLRLARPGEPVPAFVVSIPAELLPLTDDERAWAVDAAKGI